MASFVTRLRAGEEPAIEARIRIATQELAKIADEIESASNYYTMDGFETLSFVTQLRVSSQFVENFLPKK